MITLPASLSYQANCSSRLEKKEMHPCKSPLPNAISAADSAHCTSQSSVVRVDRLDTTNISKELTNLNFFFVFVCPFFVYVCPSFTIKLYLLVAVNTIVIKAKATLTPSKEPVHPSRQALGSFCPTAPEWLQRKKERKKISFPILFLFLAQSTNILLCVILCRLFIRVTQNRSKSRCTATLICTTREGSQALNLARTRTKLQWHSWRLLTRDGRKLTLSLHPSSGNSHVEDIMLVPDEGWQMSNTYLAYIVFKKCY